MWKVNRLLYKLPNRPFAKTAKDNRIARLVDLNYVIDDLNGILEEIEVAIAAGGVGGPIIKAGFVTEEWTSEFSSYGGSLYAAVVFDTPMPDFHYTPSVTFGWKDKYTYSIHSVTPGGFIIVLNASDPFVGEDVRWSAIQHTQ